MLNAASGPAVSVEVGVGVAVGVGVGVGVAVGVGVGVAVGVGVGVAVGVGVVVGVAVDVGVDVEFWASTGPATANPRATATTSRPRRTDRIIVGTRLRGRR
jgi:hypothetical protein